MTDENITPWQWQSLYGGELVVGEVELLKVLKRGEKGGRQLADRVTWQLSSWSCGMGHGSTVKDSR